jgi:metallo-beta-lactamase class B
MDNACAFKQSFFKLATMKLLGNILLLVSMTCSASAYAIAQDDDESINCGKCVEWNQPQQPFNLYGNTWYVGTSELSSVLITGPHGHILLDGDLPQSAKLIENNIRALGFRVEDIKLIVNSHAHYDHAGGIAALQRASGAKVAASASSAQTLKDGMIGNDDPQYSSSWRKMPKLHAVPIKIVTDGETVKIGELAVTAHMTPGHTPGSTTWTWQSCDGGRCLDIVYADSLNAASNDVFYYSGDATHPDISAQFRASIAKVAALKCDVIVSVHPDFTDTMDKLAKKTATNNPFIYPNGCREYAADGDAALTKRLEREKDEKAAAK